MKKHSRKSSRVGALLRASLIASALLSPVPGLSAPPIIPWRATGPAELGVIPGPDGKPFATLSASWSTESLQVVVSVHDENHAPADSINRIWAGDGIELAIDAAGDANRNLSPATSGAIGSDDFKFVFALLSDGPVGRALVSKEKIPDEAVGGLARVTREGTITRYVLELPWSFLNASPGARPAIGLDLQVNDRPADDVEKTVHVWGKGFERGFTASQLNRFQLAPPPSPVVSLLWDNATVWAPQEKNRLAVGVHSDSPRSLEFEVDGKTVSTLALEGGPGWRHYELEFPAGPHGAALVASVQGFPAATATQISASDLHRRLQDRLSELLAPADLHPLFRLHLQSLSSLAYSDWARAKLRLDGGDPRQAAASLEHFEKLLNGLLGECGDWNAYLDGRRSLVVAYVSPHDQSVQYYFLGLPKDWEPSRAYPLFFELHGAGNAHPMGGIAHRLGVEAKAMDLHGYSTPKTIAEIDRSGYWVHPFGRGNLGYSGIARIDVLEAYDHAHRLVRIDPDRRYLYGFSMGGGGTFTLAARTPSRWAAACSVAPGARSVDGPLTPNFAMVPYKIMCGEQDSLLRSYQQIIAALARHDIKPEARVVPNLGHQYLAELQKEKMDWLKTHTRKRPDSFSFVTDDNLTNTCWGITLQLPGDPRAVAKAAVRREGRTVHIDTEGAERVVIDFSEPDGLGLSGDVEVVWNGERAYSGPAKALELGLDSRRER